MARRRSTTAPSSVELLAPLSPRERSIIVWRYYLDAPESEVARQLGVSTGTVKSTASRALARLRSAHSTCRKGPTMTTHHDELDRLLAAEPAAPGSPDIGAIRHAGRRLRTRRRILTGLASLAVVGAIGIPTALVASGGPETAAPAGPASVGGDHASAPDGRRDWSLEDLRKDIEPSGAGSMACRFVRPDEHMRESRHRGGRGPPDGHLRG